MKERTETATLAGGCFWCLEAVFEGLHGVKQVVPGYTGGQKANPSYREVCTGATGHAEAIQITFDPRVISYRDLLEVFFSVHDPTTLNYQDADYGTQYRSAIFYHSPQQKQEAERIISELTESGVWPRPIVTEVKPLTEFYLAEEYHHQYFRRNPDQDYCQMVIAPKLEKFRKKYAAKLSAS
ncbi:MAG: peptide-methionine (S)-S-oxide reductase MsrA [Dehalococcoidia bacterium]|nr:peptide-methionine (S)-S-oxide reductase MsrA [Dehalococcoidia bacterium]